MSNEARLDRAYKYNDEWLLTEDCTLYRVYLDGSSTPKFSKALKIDIDNESKQYRIQYLLDVPDDAVECTLRLLMYKGVIGGDYKRI